jgi:hypothetical protein
MQLHLSHNRQGVSRAIPAALAGGDTPFNVPIRRVYIFNWSLKFTLVTPIPPPLPIVSTGAISCANKLRWIKLHDGRADEIHRLNLLSSTPATSSPSFSRFSSWYARKKLASKLSRPSARIYFSRATIFSIARYICRGDVLITSDWRKLSNWKTQSIWHAVITN